MGRILSAAPVPTVPVARGGGPTVGTLAIDEARARLANARCKVRLACSTDEDLDSCTTREIAALGPLGDDCPTVDASRLEACLAATTLRACIPSAPPECERDALCVR